VVGYCSSVRERYHNFYIGEYAFFLGQDMKAEVSETRKQNQINSDYDWLTMQNLSEYKGQWIAVLNREIIARGNSLKKVMEKASSRSLPHKPLYIQVPKESVIA